MAKLSKLKRQEKAKVKLRARKLPKGQNVTDTSFKTKKIIIPGQLKDPEKGDIYTKKKLNITELLSHLNHHNMTMRREGLLGLNELLSLYQDEIITLHLPRVVDFVCGLILDPVRDIRKTAMNFIEAILSKVSYQQISPLFNVLRTYLSCAMTHINRYIREDSIILLDVLLNVCPLLMTYKADEFLPIFLNMISNMKNGSEDSRTLSVDLESRLTSVRWRIKIFSRLTKYFSAVVASKGTKQTCATPVSESINETGIAETSPNVVKWNKDSPLYAAEFFQYSLEVCSLPNIFSHTSLLEKYVDSGDLLPVRHQFTLNQETSLKKHIEGLMVILFEAWVEAILKRGALGENVISSEAAVTMQYVVETLQHVWDCLQSWQQETNVEDLTAWFIREYRKDILKAFMAGFPFSLEKNVFTPKESQPKYARIFHQEQSLEENFRALRPNLMQQNLSLCYLFTCVLDEKSTQDIKQVVKYMQSCVMDFENVRLLPLLNKVLKSIMKKSWGNEELVQSMTAVILNNSANKKLQLTLILFVCDVHVVSQLNLRDQDFEKYFTTLFGFFSQLEVPSEIVKALHLLSFHKHGIFIKAMKKRIKSIIRSILEIRVTGTSTPIEGQKAIIDMLFPIVDQQMFNVLISVIGTSEEQHKELLEYVLNLKSLSQYLSL